MKNLVIVELNKMRSLKSLKNGGKRNFILTVLLLIATVGGYAQNNRVMNVNDFINNLSSTSNTEQITKLKSYLKDLKPTVYVDNGVITKKTDNPACIYTDVKSIKSINTIGLDNRNIEYVSIKVKSKSDIVSPIDLGAFSEFPNLKYILLVFEFEISRSAAETSVFKVSENQSVLYKVEIQS